MRVLQRLRKVLLRFLEVSTRVLKGFVFGSILFRVSGLIQSKGFQLESSGIGVWGKGRLNLVGVVPAS